MSEQSSEEPKEDRAETGQAVAFGCVPMAALGAAIVGVAFLPLVMIGILSLLALPMALALTSWFALFGYSKQRDAAWTLPTIAAGLIALGWASFELTYYAMGLVNPYVFGDYVDGFPAVAAFLGLLAPCILAVCMQIRGRLAEGYLHRLIFYWLSYLILSPLLGALMASTGWGDSV